MGTGMEMEINSWKWEGLEIGNISALRMRCCCCCKLLIAVDAVT